MDRAASAAGRRRSRLPRSTLAIGLAVHALIGRLFPEPRSRCCGTCVLALCVCIVLLGYFGLRARALSPAIAESRLQALQARIRPHFLFNSINAVLSLIRSDPKQAETALDDMADLFRVLMRDNRELVPLADEIELCRQYLALEKLRLSDRLHVEWHLNSMPADALVPPLCCSRCWKTRSTTASSRRRRRASSRSTSSTRAAKCTRSCAIRTRRRRRHHAGNKMALANIRERLRCISTPRRSLESRVRDATYEVHIRMPYRPGRPRRGAVAPQPRTTGRSRTGATAARRPARRRSTRAPHG